MNVIALPTEVVSRQYSVVSSESVSGVRRPVSDVQARPSLTPNTQHPTPLLVGRDTELAHLHSSLDKAMSGERQIVFVSGEAGIGKTTLVDAFLAQLRDRSDLRISSGQCVEQYGPGEAYMPLLEAIVRLCRGPSRERRIEDLKRYAPSLLVQLPGLLDPVEQGRLQGQIQGTSRERMLRELAQAAELFTPRRGLVLVLEDLHWSDVSTLEWLSYIARRREPAKLFIIGTYRPTDILASGHPLKGVVQELQSRRLCEELRVTSLNEEAIAEYLYSRFGEMTLPETTATTLARRTGGNPLFVVSTIDYFVRQGAVTQEAGQWTLQTDKVKEIGQDIPDTLRQLIERQVERLSEAEQRLLEVASVAGVEFTVADVAAGLSTVVEEAEACCERFARAKQWVRAVGLTELPDGTVSGRYSFLHAMYQEVISSRIAEIRRIQLHRRIALNKEAVYGERVGEIAAELAVHFEKGRELTRAVHYLGQAGEKAVQRCAHGEASFLLTRGIELLKTLPQTTDRAQQELQLCLTLGSSLMVTKGYGAPELERVYARARELSQQGQETLQMFAILAGLWTFYATRAQLQVARELAEQCLTIADKLQLPLTLVWAHYFMAQTLGALGELPESRAHFEQSLNSYDLDKHNPQVVTSPQDPGETCLAYLARVLWLQGYPEQALVKSEEACTLAQQLGHQYSLAHALGLSAFLHHLRRQAPAAQERVEAAHALLVESGSPLLAQGTILQGWALAEQGKPEEGVAKTLHGLTTWQASGAKLWKPYYLSLLAEAHTTANQIEEGQRVVEEALQHIEEAREYVYAAELYRLKGELTLQKFSVVSSQLSVSKPRPLIPDPQGEAEAYFLRAIEIARQQQAKSLELRAATSLARLWQQQNKAAKAHELLQEVYNWFTEGFDTKDLQDAAVLLTELGGIQANQKSKGKNQKAKIEAENRKLEGTIEQQEDATPIIRSPDHPIAHLSSQSPSSSVAHSPIRPLAHSFSESPTPNAFHSIGDYWTLCFAGTTCHLKDALGLHYIAHLLQHPHQEVHVVTLLTTGAELSAGQTPASLLQDSGLSVSDMKGGSDAIEILDPQARAAYKQRLNELREELDEAQRFHDVGRSEQLAAEIDALTHELASAIGLGGQTQRQSQTERARVNISRAIKVSLRKISEHHPALGQHLTATIKTGAYCSYTPDPRVPVAWEG